MDLHSVDLIEKFAQVPEHYSPKLVAQVNDTAVKIAKFKGPFTWHQHDDADELFLVIKGTLEIAIKDAASIIAGENQLAVIPKGVEHCPIAQEEVWVVLLEPRELINTGNVVNEFTVAHIEEI